MGLNVGAKAATQTATHTESANSGILKTNDDDAANIPDALNLKTSDGSQPENMEKTIDLNKPKNDSNPPKLKELPEGTKEEFSEDIDRDGNPLKVYNVKDASGKVIRQTTRDEYGSDILYKDMSYDKAGNLTQKATFYANGRLDNYVSSSYENGNDQPSRTTSYNADGTVKEYTDDSYNENGYLNHTETHGANGELKSAKDIEYAPNSAEVIKETNYGAQGN